MHSLWPDKAILQRVGLFLHISSVSPSSINFVARYIVPLISIMASCLIWNIQIYHINRPAVDSAKVPHHTSYKYYDIWWRIERWTSKQHYYTCKEWGLDSSYQSHKKAGGREFIATLCFTYLFAQPQSNSQECTILVDWHTTNRVPRVDTTLHVIISRAYLRPNINLFAIYVLVFSTNENVCAQTIQNPQHISHPETISHVVPIVI